MATYITNSFQSYGYDRSGTVDSSAGITDMGDYVDMVDPYGKWHKVWNEDVEEALKANMKMAKAGESIKMIG